MKNMKNIKELEKMTNVERGYLIAKLFPKHIKDLTDFIKRETERLRKDEKSVREAWPKDTFDEETGVTNVVMLPADTWYHIIGDTEEILRRNEDLTPEEFANQLFQLPIIHFVEECLKAYSKSEECDPKLKAGITCFCV